MKHFLQSHAAFDLRLFYGYSYKMTIARTI